MRRRDRVALALSLLSTLRHDRELTLGFIAAQIGVGETYLSRAIAGETGSDFASLLHGPRLMDAVVLLRTSDLPVKEIAWAVGYRRTNELDTHFGPWFHMTPHDFRSVMHPNLRSGPGALTAARDMRFQYPNRTVGEIADSLGLDFGTVAGLFAHSS